MKIFTIDTDNNIAVHASASDAEAVANAERFQEEASLGELAATGPQPG
jgi:hypothetical protein